MRRLPISVENFYMIPNMGVFTDAYNIDEPIYQDGFVNLYYGNGTQMDGEHEYNKLIYMTYEGDEIDNYESWVDSGVPTSWENAFNITDQFLTTQEIHVSGEVLYHQLFDLTNDIIDDEELSTILGDIPGTYFGVLLPDDISATQIKAVGIPYEYDLSVQGFPTGDYIDGTYCKVTTSYRTRNFDTRAAEELLDFIDYSLEFANNGSQYIVFYQPESVVLNYALNNKFMVDYWSYYTFIEGFDYDIIEDPNDPYVSVIDWDYEIEALTSYTMHPDFATFSSFTIGFSALDWSLVDNDYIQDGVDEFTFRPEVQYNISVLYIDDDLDTFSIYGIIPEAQFNDSSVFKRLYVSVWKDEDETTIDICRLEYPIFYENIFQDENESYYYWLNFTKIQEDIQSIKGDTSWTIVPDSFTFIEVLFISEQLRYSLGHTPFNYDYLGSGHEAYHIKLTIEGSDPIYSNDTIEFSKYVLKIVDNYIYFQDRNFTEDGYIANKSEITIEYKYKLQPGILDEEHFLMVIYPWTNVFDTVLDGDTISYREKYRKLSGSSIISPFEYSLSINDTYSLHLSYRLNQREHIEEKFEFDYSSDNHEFYYLQDGLDSYISELEDSDIIVYYYDEDGKAKELHESLFTVDTDLHKITLHHGVIMVGSFPDAYPTFIQNPIILPNEISEFYVSFFAQPHDLSFTSHTFTYTPSEDITESLDVKYWNVVGGDRLDVIPNFNSYYYTEIEESTYTNTVCRATQISAYIEDGNTLTFDLEGELTWYDPQLLDEIQDGDTYLALYVNTIIENYESLEKILIELYDAPDSIWESKELISAFNISIEELTSSDFTLKIDLPATASNGLDQIEITPIFRIDAEYSEDNVIGVPQFEFLEWDDQMTNYDDSGIRVMQYPLESSLFIDDSPLEIAYLFNNKLEYLALPEGIEFTWIEEEIFNGEAVYILQIPEIYKNPDNPSENCTFENGDPIMIRYNSPVEKAVQVGIEELYFQKRPYNYNNFPEIAEILLINTDNANDYEQFTTPYSYNISIPLTPFETEYLGNYRQFTIELNLSILESFAEDGYIDLSHLVLSVPNPAYELTIEKVVIFQESPRNYAIADTISERIWQFTEREEFVSSDDPTNDEYQLTLENEPLFYNDVDEGKWIEYLNIFDKDGNYYSAGLKGDDYQLLWNSTTGNFTWNTAFDQFQDYWGIEFELPMIIEPNTTLYFEYCTSDSWSYDIRSYYENIDASALSLIYNYDFLLKPHYYDWYGNIFENEEYDYEIEQFCAETFTVYSNVDEYSHIFDIKYDLEQDFVNLSLHKVIGFYPNYTEVVIEDDNTNYNVEFDIASKNITIFDLDVDDGYLSQFDSITVILNFTFGPVSTYTQITLSEYFNQSFLTSLEETFYDEIYGSFYSIRSIPDYLFAEGYESITSNSSSFKSINYTRNPHLGDSPILKGYDEYELYLNYQLFEDPFNIIYEADLNQDGAVDYKHEIDVDKDGRIDITKYGIEDPENPSEIIWYRVIQDFESVTKTVEKAYESSETKWFNINDNQLVSEVGQIAPTEYSTHFRGKRFATKYIFTELSQYTRFYSIKLDDNLDGYADSQFEYIKETNVIDYSIEIVHETLVGENALSRLHEIGLTARQFLDMSKSEFLGWPRAKDFLFDYCHGMDKDEKYRNFIRYSQVYIEKLRLDYTNTHTTEELIYYDIEEGEVVETRHYSDKFIDDESLFTCEEDIETLSIINLDTEQQLDISSMNVLVNASQLGWTTEIWGIDNVPVKFDSVTITQDDSVTISNINEKTIYINIDNGYSLFYDYLQTGPSTIKNGGTTTFKVSGVLITPTDGVYFTSDKEAFGSSSTHDEAKTTGHYLYYDSDQNNFYETVFILLPDDDNNGVYDVLSIGYNYDGSHDFSPYVMVELSNEIFGTVHFSGIQEVEPYRGNWRMDIDILTAVDYLYPKDLSDGYGTKDQIFEISKLTNILENYPELYYQVYKKQYADAYHSYRENLLTDIADQVGSTVTAGTAAAVVGIYAPYLAPFVFVGIYFLFSWIGKEAKKREMASLEKARTYYSSDSDKSKPQRLNKMRTSDVEKEGIPAALEGHPGAYYTKAYGGIHGDMYEADIITSPPLSWRKSPETDIVYCEECGYGPISVEEAFGFCVYECPQCGHFEQLDNKINWNKYNLDFSLITSELPGLADTLNSLYPSSGDSKEKYFSITLDSDRINLYNAYRTNTIGYIEQEVGVASNGQFDTISPYCINGIPQYMFIDSQDIISTISQPLSSLYTPIIVSQYRYDELDWLGQINDAVMTIDVDCAYGLAEPFHNDGFNAYQLDPLETESYKAKIPLSSKEFSYPITKIIIEVPYHLADTILKTVEVDSDSYTVVDGNLYFYDTLEEIVFSSYDEWDQLTYLYTIFGNRYHKNVNYDVHVYFATIIPYVEPSRDDIQDQNFNIEDHSWFTSFSSQVGTFSPEIIDTTSNDLARTALAQATTYTISNYFNQYQMGYTDATNKAERDYTVLVTFWSTLISNLVLLPITAAAGVMSSAMSFTQTLAVQAIKVLPGVITEIFEELYVDPYIESWINARFYEMGGDENAADFWSMLATSFREAFVGGVSSLINSFGSDSDSSSSFEFDEESSLEVNLQSQQEYYQQKIAELDSKKAWKSIFDFGTFAGIATTIPSFFLGGAGIGIMSLGLDISTDILQTKLRNYYLKGILETQLGQTNLLLEALKPQPKIDTDAINIAWLFDQPSVQSIPSVMPAAAIMTSPAMTMTRIPFDDLRNIEREMQKEKIKQAKGNHEVLNELEGIVPEELEGAQDRYDSLELDKIAKILDNLRGKMYNDFEILVEPGVYGGISYKVINMILEKISKGKVLTDLEREIMSTGAYIMGAPSRIIGGPKFIKGSWQEGTESPYSPDFDNFINQLNSELQGFGIDLDDILFTDTPGRDLDTIQIELNDGYKFNIEELGFKYVPNSGEMTLDRWLVRIENKILSDTSVSEAVKQDIIDSVKDEFNYYYSISGWAAENPFYREARLLIFRVGEVLLKEGVIDANIISEINKFMGNTYECRNLFRYLKQDPSKVPDLGEKSTIYKFESALFAKIERIRNNQIKKRLTDSVGLLINGYKHTVQLHIQGRDLLEDIPNCPRKDLIADIIASSKVLQSIQYSRALSNLLFGDRMYLSQTYFKGSRISIRLEPKILFAMRLRISQWTTAMFKDEHLTIDENSLERLKKVALSTIEIFMIDYENDAFIARISMSGNLVSREVLEHHLRFVYSLWAAASVYKNDPTLSVGEASDLFGYGNNLFGPLSKGHNFDGMTLKRILLKLNKLIAEESTNIAPFMSEIPISLSWKSAVYNDALEALTKYKEIAGISFAPYGGSRGFTPQSPTISESALGFLSKDAKYNKFVALLEKAEEGFTQYVHTRYNSKGISTEFNKRLIGVHKSVKESFIDDFINDNYATQYRRGDINSPDIVRELIHLAQGSGTGAGGAISHEALVGKVKDSPYFIAAEAPLHISFSDALGDRSYAGQPDYLLYDYVNKKIYVADYKPDLSFSDKGAWSFINSIPQVAAYALILQAVTGIKVECLIFNSGGAMTFDPINVLAPINTFMQTNIQSWVPPWKDFSTYLK